jgi:hypothetical protein
VTHFLFEHHCAELCYTVIQHTSVGLGNFKFSLSSLRGLCSHVATVTSESRVRNSSWVEGSSTCCKCMASTFETRGFPSKGCCGADLNRLQNLLSLAGFEPTNLVSSGEHINTILGRLVLCVFISVELLVMSQWHSYTNQNVSVHECCSTSEQYGCFKWHRVGGSISNSDDNPSCLMYLRLTYVPMSKDSYVDLYATRHITGMLQVNDGKNYT